MRAYVVVESLTGEPLVARLLAQEIQQQTMVVPGRGRGSATSVARTLLVSRQKPVAVLVDADTFVDGPTTHLRQETKELVRMASAGAPSQVFVVVPKLEVLLFQVPAALERIAGHPLSPVSLAVSRYDPALVIRQLGRTVDQVVNGLTDEEVNVIRDASPIKELIAFLAEQVTPLPQTASP